MLHIADKLKRKSPMQAFAEVVDATCESNGAAASSLFSCDVHSLSQDHFSQPAHDVVATLVISIHVATSNNIHTTSLQSLVINATRTLKVDVVIKLKLTRQPNPTSLERLVINVIS